MKETSLFAYLLRLNGIQRHCSRIGCGTWSQYIAEASQAPTEHDGIIPQKTLY